MPEAPRLAGFSSNSRANWRGALLEGEGVVRECLVGVLDLLEDLLEFLLRSLVVHHLL
jgi:hypothetical protein